MKKTKIIATLGPASSDKEVLKQMFIEGVNVCRLNFSHGDHESTRKQIKTIHELNEETGFNVAILADLQGPKIRTGKMEENSVLVEGAKVTITTSEMLGNAKKFSINYGQLPQDVLPGERILLDDGKLSMDIIETNGKDEIIAKVIYGGVLTSNKGVNLPNTKNLDAVFNGKG